MNMTVFIQRVNSVYIFSSAMFELESLNSYDPFGEYYPNVPLKVQPEVQITDFYNRPIQGKRIIAFSWVEPNFEAEVGYKYTPSNKKYLTFKNSMSELSDKDGIARFKNLTVIGKIDSTAYIHFYCEGVVIPWSNKRLSKYYNMALPPRLIPPITIKYPNLIVNIINDFKRVEVEGKALSSPYEIQVLSGDEEHKPVPNILCYASLYRSRGNIIPFGYQSSWPNHPTKYIERPIPGIYNSDAYNLESESSIIKAYNTTDKYGRVVFQSMRFSESGPTGNYTVGFNCGNDVTISSFDVIVESSIDKNKIRFVNHIKSPIIITPNNNQNYDLLFEIVVNNKDDYGVSGKYPEEIYVYAKNSQEQKNILAKIMHGDSSFEASNEDGIMIIPVKITKLVKSMVANITLQIDNFNITSQDIEFILDSEFNEVEPGLSIKSIESKQVDYNSNIKRSFTESKLSKNPISRVEITSYPINQFERGLNISEQFRVTAVFYNIVGEVLPCDMNNTNIEVMFNHVDQAPVPKNFYELQCTYNYCQANSYIFGKCEFSRAAAGHYFIQVVKKEQIFNRNTREYLNYTFASSQLIRVKINNIVEYADLGRIYEDTASDNDNFDEEVIHQLKRSTVSKRSFNNNNSNFGNDQADLTDYTEVKLNKSYYIELRLFDSQYRPLINQQLMRRPIPSFVEYPPSMNSIKEKVEQYFSFVGFSNRTNDKGFYYIKFYVRYGIIGAFSFAFDFGTCNSDSISIETNNVLKSISIIQEPGFKNQSFDDEKLQAWYTGRIFDIKAKIKIEVSEGPLSGYVVVAQPLNLTQSYFSVDFFTTSRYTLDEKKENYYGWVSILPARIAITNRNGEATFEDLGIFDMSGMFGTCKFYFAVGDRRPNKYLISPLTQSSYNFVPSVKFEIVNQPSSFISANTFISSNPKIRAISKVQRKYWILSMQLFEFNNHKVDETLNSDFTIKFIYNNFCFMIATESIKTIGRCNWRIYSTSSSDIKQFYEVEFTGIKWSIHGISTGVIMSFASALQHNTTNAALSRKVEVETNANSLTFITDPPETISVKEIFRIDLEAKIKGGAPLTDSTIECNITKSFNPANLTYEIFTSLGNTKFNIQKSNLLSPGSKLEESMTRGITNKDGIAKIYLQIKESPLNSEVRIMCQTGNIVTPYSSPIKVTHPIERISLAQNYYETVKVNFEGTQSNNVLPNVYSQGDFIVKLKSEIVLHIDQDNHLNSEISPDDVNILLVK